MEELVRYLRALLLLQLQAAQVAAERGQALPIKPEVILADAGFSHRDIAGMLGKSQMAVAKAISRARSIRQKGGPADQSLETQQGGESDA